MTGPLVVAEAVSRRFWSKVDQSAGPDGCWPFTGALSDSGYGRFAAPEEGGWRIWIASRFALAITRGFDLAKQACHRCDAPACCNPAHLFEATQRENIRDMWAKGRASPPPIAFGSSNHATKLTPDLVEQLRADRRDGLKLWELSFCHALAKSTVKRALSGGAWCRTSERTA